MTHRDVTVKFFENRKKLNANFDKINKLLKHPEEKRNRSKAATFIRRNKTILKENAGLARQAEREARKFRVYSRPTKATREQARLKREMEERF